MATNTTAFGFNSFLRQTISKNLKPPKSDPKPASVITKGDNFLASLIALTELTPGAILAKGPP